MHRTAEHQRAATRLEGLAADADTLADFTAQADALVRELVGYDVAAWGSVDPATALFTACDLWPTGVPSAEQQLMELEFADVDPGSYRDLNRRQVTAAALRQYADPETVERYRRVIAPGGGYDELRVMLRVGDQLWGAVTAYRVGRAFHPDDVATAARLAPTLAHGFRRTFLNAALRSNRLDRPPGHLVLEGDGQPATSTAPAEEWLDTLHEAARRGVFASLVQATRAGEVARVSVEGARGLLTFHAHPLKGADDHVGVIVEQPRPAELAPVVLDALGLTDREVEVVELVLRGHSARQIARRLAITEHTVSDHLKAVFGKAGVSSRAELVARVYVGFYLPRTEAGAEPSPYGWFLEGD